MKNFKKFVITTTVLAGMLGSGLLMTSCKKDTVKMESITPTTAELESLPPTTSTDEEAEATGEEETTESETSVEESIEASVLESITEQSEKESVEESVKESVEASVQESIEEEKQSQTDPETGIVIERETQGDDLVLPPAIDEEVESAKEPSEKDTRPVEDLVIEDDKTEEVVPSVAEVTQTSKVTIPGAMELEDVKKEIVKADNLLDFSFNLFREIVNEKGLEENLSVSPYSATAALTLTAIGSDGNSKQEFTDILGRDIEEVIGVLTKTLDMATNDENEKPVLSANSLWINEGVDISKSYKDEALNKMGATAETRDFTDIRTLYEVNNWIESNTNKKIKDMLSELDPDNGMLLINAMYLKDNWVDAFDEIDEEIPFTNSSGETVLPKYIRQFNGNALKYVSTDEWEGFTIPTESGIRFMAIKAKDDYKLNDIIDNMNTDKFKESFKSMDGKNYNLTVTIPEFEYESNTFSIKDAMLDLGFSDVFNKDKANFTPMLENETDKLWINDVKQKTFIDFNKDGIEGAAATVIDMEFASAAMDPEDFTNIELTFDETFLFLVYYAPDYEFMYKDGVESDVIPFFMGIIDEPTLIQSENK